MKFPLLTVYEYRGSLRKASGRGQNARPVAHIMQGGLEGKSPVCSMTDDGKVRMVEMKKQKERDIISGRLHDKKLRQILAGLSALMSVVIALVVVVNLVQPVNTMTTICGKEEHTHTSECYTQELACAHEGEADHSHTAECYKNVLSCGKSEHTHTDACYPKTEEAEEPQAEPKEVKAEAVPEQDDAPEQAAVSEGNEAAPEQGDGEVVVTSENVEAAQSEEENPAAEPGQTPDEAGEGEQPAADEAPAVKVESVVVNPGTVLPNESAAFSFVTANAVKLNYTLTRLGETVASGELLAGETSYAFTPDKIGDYTFSLTATGADEKQDAASATLRVARATSLTVSAQADQRSVLGGQTASFTLSSEAASEEGLNCSIVVKQGETVIYEAKEFQERVSVATKKTDAVTAITLTVTLEDVLKNTAQAEASIPCAVDKVETQAQWEKTMHGVKHTGVWADDLIAIAESQVGYRESAENFVIKEDGKAQGWTRYGAKYGIPYDEWCAAFVSFCLDYARVPSADVPRSVSCQKWIQALQSEGLYASRKNASPQRGDLVFFDWADGQTGGRDGVADHIGICISADGSSIHTLEGNHGKSVSYVTYSAGDGSILGYGLLSKAYEAHLAAQKIEYTYTGEGFTAKAACTGLARLPENAKLVVEETALADPDREAIAAAFGGETLSAVADARAYVVSFAADGETVQAKDTVTVTVTFGEGIAVAEDAAVKGFSLMGGAVKAQDVEPETVDGALKAITFAAEPYVSYGAAVLTSAEEAEVDETEEKGEEEKEENPEENEVGSDKPVEETDDAKAGDDDEVDETEKTDETEKDDESEKTDETDKDDAVEYTAEIALPAAEAPFSLLSLLTEANADAALAGDLTLDYDKELLSIEEADGDYLVALLGDFECTVLTAEMDGARYTLELTIEAEPDEASGVLKGRHRVAVDGADYNLSVNVPESANLPAGAHFVASAVTEDAETYIAKALEAVAGDANAEGYQVLALFDLTIYDEDNLQPAEEIEQGDKVCIHEIVDPVSVKLVETGRMKQTIEYETVKEESDEYYKGDTHTAQEGVDGIQIFEGTLYKIGGKVSRRDAKSIETVREKQDKIILVGTAERPKTAPTGTYKIPTENYIISSNFGPRWGRLHSGVDMAAPGGTPIYATDGGEIIRASYYSGYGNCIDIDHGNGRVTRYGHCSRILVNVGDKVYQGQLIGLVGSTGNSTGNHLHFEIRFNDVPTDPRPYLGI